MASRTIDASKSLGNAIMSSPQKIEHVRYLRRSTAFVLLLLLRQNIHTQHLFPQQQQEQRQQHVHVASRLKQPTAQPNFDISHNTMTEQWSGSLGPRKKAELLELSNQLGVFEGFNPARAKCSQLALPHHRPSNRHLSN